MDSRPKRRKDKDNPYEIFLDGYKTESPHYYMSFRDGMSQEQNIEISQELFQALDQFELEDLSYLNKVDRYYEHSELTEISLHKRAFNQLESVEETALRYIQNEDLHHAIKKLSEKQRRRLILYYFEEYTYEQIAKMENCSKVAVKYSIDKAIVALRKFLSDF